MKKNYEPPILEIQEFSPIKDILTISETISENPLPNPTEWMSLAPENSSPVGFGW